MPSKAAQQPGEARLAAVRLARRSGADETPHPLLERREQLLAAGRPLLDLSDSNPTRHGLLDEAVLPTVARAVAREGVYEPDPRGPSAAREAVAAWRGGDPSDVWLAASTSEAYSWLLSVLADPGQEVAVPVPGYPLLEPLARLAGMSTVGYPVHYLHPHGWEIDLDALRSVLARPAVRVVVVVSPGNPTGAYLDADALTAVSAACAEHGVVLVLDEVFGPFAVEGSRPSRRPLEGVTCTLDGLSKLLCAPQLKVAWLALDGPGRDLPPLRRALDQAADAVLSLGPAAAALGDLLALAPASVARTRSRLAANLATARAVLEAPYRVRRCDGGWSVVVDAPRYADDDETGLALLAAGLWAQPGWLYDLTDEGSWVLSLLPQPAAFADGCRRLRDVVDGLA